MQYFSINRLFLNFQVTKKTFASSSCKSTLPSNPNYPLCRFINAVHYDKRVIAKGLILLENPIGSHIVGTKSNLIYLLKILFNLDINNAKLYDSKGLQLTLSSPQDILKLTGKLVIISPQDNIDLKRLNSELGKSAERPLCHYVNINFLPSPRFPPRQGTIIIENPRGRRIINDLPNLKKSVSTIEKGSCVKA